jgi:hypothetical protein
VADGVFRNNHQLAVVLEDKDCHSDIEDAPGNVPPVSLFPPWRSLHLTRILHHLDSMAQDQATHYKTIKTNNQVYGRSARNHGKYVGGTTGVAQNWPIDCYDQTFWDGLGKYQQDIISTVPPINIQQIAENMGKMCGKTRPAAPSGSGDQGTSSRGQKRPKDKGKENGEGPSEKVPDGTMVVD